MEGKQFSELSILDLSRTYIGDEGIKKLVTNSFPQLYVLRLIDIGITEKGLAYLDNLDAPNLQQLDLSCNDLLMDAV